jgi:TolB-like protein
LGEIIERSLEKDPKRRFRSALDVRKELADVRKAVELELGAEALAADKSVPSIAVLPFVDMSPQKDQGYFTDGLAEDLINALTQIKELRVAARTSSFCFRGKELDIREIGTKLNVEAVLEGSVQKAGDRLRITAQLIDVANGFHLWSDRFDREMKDVFAIQDEISEAIVNTLAAKLVKDEPRAPV